MLGSVLGVPFFRLLIDWVSGTAARALLCLKRQDVLPVSTMWQWCVSRSSSAVVILASPKTPAHSREAQVGGDHHAGALVEL